MLPFRHPKTHQRLTRSLFYECSPNKELVIYTLKRIDWKGHTSFYKRYMEIGDPTEYKQANTLTENWEHWCKLCECNWFKPFIHRWRKELQIKMKSEAIGRIVGEAKTNPKETVNASKYLLDKIIDQANKDLPQKEKTSKRPVGRPSDQAILNEAMNLFNEQETIEKDMKHLRTIN